MKRIMFTKSMEHQWEVDPRWRGIQRPYAADDVWRLTGSFRQDYRLASLGAERLWDLMQDRSFVPALSAVTGTQAVQQVRAGLPAVYVSGWQVAGDSNTAGETYPDLSLYPVDSVPALVGRINKALIRADQIHHARDDHQTHWLAPVVADAEAGFGGILNVYEVMKHMIDQGAAGVHFEDQLASQKKCGHLGGKVLVPTAEFVDKLVAARLAADVCGVPTVLIARTDALSAGLLSSDADPLDCEFLTGERSVGGYWHVRSGIDAAIARGLAYAPYADVLWFETSTPDLGEARQFSEAIHDKHPDKLLAYNCSPSFNWNKHLDQRELEQFQKELAAMGYRFQFVTLSGFHVLNHAMFSLARDYCARGMAAYAELQTEEFEAESHGYEATRHQEFVGARYFDDIATIIQGGTTGTLAMEGSTEQQQFSRVPRQHTSDLLARRPILPRRSQGSPSP